ncbi:MAG: hypothetical protein K0R67_3537 [Paenibacillus sp.]|nr:hypothetical protein [Paenibacillus sp.]
MNKQSQDVYVSLLDNYPKLASCGSSIKEAFELLSESYHGYGKLLVCGNGGSASDAEHIVGELMKGFMLRRPLSSEQTSLFDLDTAEGQFLADHLQGALPAISLVSHSSLISAVANDTSAEIVFAQQVYGYGRPGDALLGLSTSGNSKNVVNAIHVAKALKLKTIGMTGPGGGKMLELCDVTIRVPAEGTPAIQELHLPVYHALCRMLEYEFFDS